MPIFGYSPHAELSFLFKEEKDFVRMYVCEPIGLEEPIPRHEIFLSYLDPASTKHSLCTASSTRQRSQQMQNNIFNSSGGFPGVNLGMERASCSTARMVMFVFEEDLAGDRWLQWFASSSQTLSLKWGYTRCNERVTEHEKGLINSRWRE